MRILVLSDIHIGDPRLHNEDDIVKLLDSVEYDRLVLNGDIVDTWLADFFTQSPVIKKLRSIAKQKPVIWVRGNHDNVSCHQTIIPGAKVKDMYLYNRKSPNPILFIHGHQVYKFMNMAPHQKILAKVNAFFYNLSGIDFQTWGRKVFLYKNVIVDKRIKVIKKYGYLSDNIVIGHTHTGISNTQR